MPVEKNGKKGYIDKTGKAVIPIRLEYSSIYSFNDGLALVAMNGVTVEMLKNETEEKLSKRWEERRYGFIDKTGKIVIPIEYEHLRFFNEGLSVSVKNGKPEFIDKTGKIAFPADYDEVSNFHEGLARVKKGDKYAFIDNTGKIKINCEKYDSAGFFKEGYASVIKHGKYGFIDKSGCIIISLDYDSVKSFYEKISVVKKNCKWGIIQI